MTEQEFNAKKIRIRSLIVTGIAAFLGAYIFRGSPGGLPGVTPTVFLAAGVLCLVVAGKNANDLMKDSASK